MFGFRKPNIKQQTPNIKSGQALEELLALAFTGGG
jgi:hypothetical protein